MNMNKVDYIYFCLCQKYGNEAIAFKKEIKTQYDMVFKDNLFEPQDEPNYLLGGVYFINIFTKEKIDLKKEAELGTFNLNKDKQ